MEYMNTGHLGFIVRDSGFTLWVDPLLPGQSAFGPAQHVSPERLPAPDCVALTSRHPLHASAPSLRAVGEDVPVVAVPACLAGLRGIDSARHRACPEGTPFEVGPFELTFVPGSEGSTLFVRCGGESLWLLGPSAISVGTALELSARTGPGRTCVVLSGYLDCPSAVVAGGARTFPEREHRRTLDTARALELAGFERVLLAGGVRFERHAAWLEAYAQALPLEDLCEDIRRFCPHLAIEPARVDDLRDEPRPFDPSLGIPDLPQACGQEPGTLEQLQRCLRQASAAPSWHSLAAALRAWSLRVCLREVSASGERWWSIALGDAPGALPGRDPLAGVIIALTSAALGRLLSGEAGAHQLALEGELRSFSRAHRLRGSAVQVPDAAGSLVCALPSAFDLLDALCPRSSVMRRESTSSA
jgi:hypothetical protein